MLVSHTARVGVATMDQMMVTQLMNSACLSHCGQSHGSHSNLAPTRRTRGPVMRSRTQHSGCMR
jgi:hypothetical protein